MYVEGIKCVNLIEINPVVIEMRGVENGELVVTVNNILVCYTAFLASDTTMCLDCYCLLASYTVCNFIACV